MTAARASLIAAIGVILEMAYRVVINVTAVAHTTWLPQDIAFVLLTSVAGGVGWTLVLLAFHDDQGQISAGVRRTAVIAASLILVEMIAPPIYFFLLPTRILTVRSGFYYAAGYLPAAAAVAFLGAFAFSRSIGLIRAASLAFALLEGASHLPRLWRAMPAVMREWNQVYTVHVFTDMIGTAILTFAWISMVGFLIALGATRPGFGENQ